MRPEAVAAEVAAVHILHVPAPVHVPALVPAAEEPAVRQKISTRPI